MVNEQTMYRWYRCENCPESLPAPDEWFPETTEETVSSIGKVCPFCKNETTLTFSEARGTVTEMGLITFNARLTTPERQKEYEINR